MEGKETGPGSYCVLRIFLPCSVFFFFRHGMFDFHESVPYKILVDNSVNIKPQ